MPWYVDVAIIIVLGLLVWFIIYRMRKRLLLLWQDVSGKEVIFYKQLEQVIRLFFEKRELIKTPDNQDLIRKLTRYRKKKIRNLLLSTRQELFQAINIMFEDIEDHTEEEYKLLIEEFEQLQKVRRVYNSKVLIYNQTISVFPTRYLALRMELELKEYFG